MDYADISAAFKPLWKKIDHNYLNPDPRPGKSHQRGNCDVDLEKAQAETAAAHRGRGGRNLYGAGGLPRRVNQVRAGGRVLGNGFEDQSGTSSVRLCSWMAFFQFVGAGSQVQ